MDNFSVRGKFLYENNSLKYNGYTKEEIISNKINARTLFEYPAAPRKIRNPNLIMITNEKTEQLINTFFTCQACGRSPICPIQVKRCFHLVCKQCFDEQIKSKEKKCPNVLCDNEISNEDYNNDIILLNLLYEMAIERKENPEKKEINFLGKKKEKEIDLSLKERQYVIQKAKVDMNTMQNDYINNRFVIINIDSRTRQNICNKSILFPLNGNLNTIAQYISMKYNYEYSPSMISLYLTDKNNIDVYLTKSTMTIEEIKKNYNLNNDITILYDITI